MADDKSASVWAVAIVFLTLSWLTVGMRLYVRVEQLGKFGLDDKLVIVAQIFFTAYLICQMGGAAYGTGRRLEDLDYESAETALRFWFFCEVWYALASTTVKVAICLTLRRVTVRFAHLIIEYGLIIWSVALGLAFLLAVIFQCNPTSDWWSLDPNKKHCLAAHTITSLTYFVSALNVACDWTLGIFPFFIVKDLSIPLAQKIMVASILAFGALGSTATIVRLAYIPTLEQTYEGWNGDFLYDTTPVAIWTTVEVGVGITATCLSTLRPLLHKLPWFSRSTTYASYQNGYPSTYSDNSHVPIPLIESQSQLEAGTSNGKSLDPNQNDYVTATRFNATKPLSGRYGEGGSSSSKKKPAPPPDFVNASKFNATKPLSNSSYG